MPTIHTTVKKRKGQECKGGSFSNSWGEKKRSETKENQPSRHRCLIKRESSLPEHLLKEISKKQRRSKLEFKERKMVGGKMQRSSCGTERVTNRVMITALGTQLKGRREERN